MSSVNPPDDSVTSGRIALVTGGSRGLGRNIAACLARGGHDIVLTYRSQKEEGTAAVAEIESLGRRAVALQLDVAQVKSFATFRDTFAKRSTTIGNKINSMLSSITRESIVAIYFPRRRKKTLTA